MDPVNPVVRLCAAGMHCEAEGRHEEAAALFRQAWAAKGEAYDACIAAHYVARHQNTPTDTLWWNEEALRQAGLVAAERVAGFLPSLHLNVAHSHEVLGNLEAARLNYTSADRLLANLSGGDAYANLVRRGIGEGLRRVKETSAKEGASDATRSVHGPDLRAL